MKKTIIHALWGLGLLLLASCDNYLDVKPQGKIIPETAEDYSTIIHYWLDLIEKGTDDAIISNSDEVKKLEMYAEDLDATLSSGNSYVSLYVGEAINDNDSYYTELYQVIKDCNTIIGNMEDTESELAKTLLGTAWGIRAISYYNLLLRYCEPYSPATAESALGMPRVDVFDMEAKPARANLKETAEFIEKNFTTALGYNVTNQDFLITASVVKAYMARFYFWTQNWNAAISYAEPLLTEFPMLEADEYAEAINQKMTKTHNVIIRSYTEDDDLGTMDYTYAQTDAKTRPVSANLVKLFATSANDIRPAVAFDSQRTVSKVITAKFRSEELCLIIAESYAHQNDEAQALKYLNMLREKRVSANFTAYTADNLPEIYKQNITEDATGQPLTKLMSAILCERRMEMFLEGDRWFELKRNGRPEFWIAANGKKYVTEKYLYQFPLPKTDIDLYPGLVIQNPGYVE